MDIKEEGMVMEEVIIEMKYNIQISKLEEKYPKNERNGNCLRISESLALLVLSEFPGHKVSTAQGINLKGERPVFYLNHYVSVIQELDGKFIALDATRPSYDGGDYWIIEADSEIELERKLSDHYKGEWKIQDKWLDKVPDWYVY